MRIIGGEFRSRRLVSPRDAVTTRPIPDRVKESLFGVLRGHTEGAHIFDAFAGTGAIGLEAISRGGARCVFVERDRKVAELLRRNIENLGVEGRCEVVIGDALGPGALARCPRPARLIFLDPPYALVTDPSGWKRIRAQMERLIDLLAEDGFAILRTPWPFLLHPEPERAAETGAARQAQRASSRAPRHADPDAQPVKRARKRAAPAGDAEDEREPIPSAQIEPELTFPNAEGPETHAYQTTAVHLYGRRARQTASSTSTRADHNTDAAQSV